MTSTWHRHPAYGRGGTPVKVISGVICRVITPVGSSYQDPLTSTYRVGYSRVSVFFFEVRVSASCKGLVLGIVVWRNGEVHDYRVLRVSDALTC